MSYVLKMMNLTAAAAMKARFYANNDDFILKMMISYRGGSREGR